MTKEQLKELLKKECADYNEVNNIIKGMLSDGTSISVTFNDAERNKPAEPIYTGFDAKLKAALNYNPKENKDK